MVEGESWMKFQLFGISELLLRTELLKIRNKCMRTEPQSAPHKVTNFVGDPASRTGGWGDKKDSITSISYGKQSETITYTKSEMDGL